MWGGGSLVSVLLFVCTGQWRPASCCGRVCVLFVLCSVVVVLQQSECALALFPKQSFAALDDVSCLVVCDLFALLE